MTLFITRIINLFLYENVILKEASRKKKFMNNAIYKDNQELLPSYKSKLTRGLIKIKVINMLVGKTLKKQKGKIISLINLI